MVSRDRKRENTCTQSLDAAATVRSTSAEFNVTGVTVERNVEQLTQIPHCMLSVTMYTSRDHDITRY